MLFQLSIMKRKTPGEGLMTLTIICLVCDLGQSLVEVRIDLSSSNYASVPQNITENVTHLILSYNDITVLDNTSFIKYSKLRIIDLGYNGIEYILEGTFDNNKHLKKLHFGHCNIKYLPPSFGPSAPSIEEIDLAAAIESNFTGIIRNQYLAQFSSLTYLRLKYIKLYTIEDIFLPRSLQHLDIAHTGLSFFPNVTSDRLPALQKLTVQHNEIQEIPEYMFSGISDLLTHFTMFRNGLNCIANFALKTKLFAIDVSGNNLETQSDLLAELPKLKKIWLEKNSRWTCDKRLCWWRLWGRFRKEIRFDNPQCVNPKWMRNFTLREVNPKFMDCFNGMVLYILTSL